MPVLDKMKALQPILERLLYQGNPEADMTGRDVATLQQGPQENRGLGNILQNISLLGARRRAGAEGLRNEREERAGKLDLMKAQAENMRSLGPYRMGMLSNVQERNRINALRAEVYKARTDNDYEIALARLETAKNNAEAAMKNAETNARRAQDQREMAEWRLEFDRAKQEYQEADDAIKNANAYKAVAIQAGWLKLGEEKAPAEKAHLEAQTGALKAGTAKTEQETQQGAESFPLEQANRGATAILGAQKAGQLTPGGSRAAFGTTMSPGLGVGPKGPSITERLGRFLGVIPEQPSYAPTQTKPFQSGIPTPQAAPQAAPQTGKIRVQRLSDGRAGTIDAKDFDPVKYRKL